jgi:hypothetical protein
MSDEQEQVRRQGTSPLSAESGRIIRNELFHEGPISVRFRGAIISPNGEIQQMEITKDGQVIGMTTAQALSLAKEIQRRLG